MAGPINPDAAAGVSRALAPIDPASNAAGADAAQFQAASGALIAPGNPLPPVIELSEGGPAAALTEQITLNKDLMQPTLGERMVQKALDATAHLNAWPHAQIGGLVSSRIPPSTPAAAPGADADALYVDTTPATGEPSVIGRQPDDAKRVSEQALQRIEGTFDEHVRSVAEVSNKIIEVMRWSMEFKLVTSMGAKGVQGLNTLLKNQG